MLFFKVFVKRLGFLGLCLQGLLFGGLRFRQPKTAFACERSEFKSLSSSFLFLFKVCVFEVCGLRFRGLRFRDTPHRSFDCDLSNRNLSPKNVFLSFVFNHLSFAVQLS